MIQHSTTMDLGTCRGTASICIPARNEAATIGELVGDLRSALVEDLGIVDEIVVVDDDSSDDTARIARNAGARVVSTRESGPSRDKSGGKGDAVWTSIATCESDFIMWVDGDMRGLDVRGLADLLAPLRTDRSVHLVKGSFVRLDSQGNPSEGRLTALTARPLLSFYFPAVANIVEPLGGIYAMRLTDARALDLESDYGIDVGILIDILMQYGPEAIVEVGLGTLSHDSRSLCDLSRTATQVIRTILSRAFKYRTLREDEALSSQGQRRLSVDKILSSLDPAWASTGYDPLLAGHGREHSLTGKGRVL